MSKYYMSKREKMDRRDMLKRFGVDGSFVTKWKDKASGNKADGTWKPCPRCGDVSYIPHQDLPGVCSRPTCRYHFVETRRGKRS